jgi:Na+-transporting NADH:ubiquinone oxidoreductase subunit A
VVLGERRALEEIAIDVAATEEHESFTRYLPEQLRTLPREEVLNHLLDTGYIALIRQRPFSRIADPAVTPKSVFVNGMNTAPFQPSLAAAVKGDEAAFQAGLDVLGTLTGGKVHLCLPGPAETLPPALREAGGVDIHTFTGPHPVGNSSVHIHHLDPISPGEQVWTVKAVDAVLLGKLFLRGDLPTRKVVAVGGPAVREEARKHYRVRIGGPLDSVLEGRVPDEEVRIVSGDVLSGTEVSRDSGFRFGDSSVCVLPRSRERRFMGWLAPGLNLHSQSPLFLSRWFRRDRTWELTTNKNGSLRAMVLTGLYDRFLPMRIKTDYLVRAVLAGDTEEAVQLGLLETDPEDFALCAFACPSKMDLVGIIRGGLDTVEEEGL